MAALLRPFGVDVLATKVIGPNGVISAYKAGWRFTGLNGYIPTDLPAQKRLMQGLTGKRNWFFIGGDIRADKADGATLVNRRMHDRPGDGPPDILDVPQKSIFVDCDGVRGSYDFRLDPARAATSVRDMTAELSGVACVFVGSSKAGLDELVRGKFLFNLSEPASMAALRAWGKDANLRAGQAVVDTGLYKATQPVYLAAPLFVNGAVDPMPERVLELPGDERALVLPPPALIVVAPVGPALPSKGGWRSHLDDIGSLGQRWREPLLHAAGSLASECADPSAATKTAEAAWRDWLGGWLAERLRLAEAAVRAGECGWTLPSRTYDLRHFLEMVNDCARLDAGRRSRVNAFIGGR